MNANFKVIGLTRLGIKPESTAPETDALYHSAIMIARINSARLTMLDTCCEDFKFEDMKTTRSLTILACDMGGPPRW